MLIKRPSDLTDHDVTDYALYQRRRDFLKLLGGVSLLGVSLPSRAGLFSTDEEITPLKDATSYNNFYEFGSNKSDPKRYAQSLKITPWSVTVDGACNKPGAYHLEDLLQPQTIEERIYRLRCVEGWSMVIPWRGFPLANLLKHFEPTSKAKFVRFETLSDEKQMPLLREELLPWPYIEGLRMDEAMHPLTLMVTGMYGKDLFKQNGAPLRLVVPWKYGFKSIKSIVRMSFVEQAPRTTWQKVADDEYGFYANVNPAVSHPRWSQKKERRIGDFFKRDTLPFNGYAEQVASLYRGMDLKVNF